jgi:protein-S-isoprenylcysteine O-methyltransferase Ste14
MDKIVLFVALSLPVIYFSKKSLFDISSHGFPRFFAFECIIWLFLSVYRVWFADPFSLAQIFSWLLLLLSIYMVAEGFFRLRKGRKPGIKRVDDKLFSFEKTTAIVSDGIYKYIRHPLYASLLFLTWGIYLKQPSLALTLVALVSSVLIWFTAVRDEKECINYFGDSYREYMKSTRRFIPFII